MNKTELETTLITFGYELLCHRLDSQNNPKPLIPEALQAIHHQLGIDYENLSPENRVQLIFQALTDQNAPTLLPITELSLAALENPSTADKLDKDFEEACKKLSDSGNGRFGTFGYLMSYFGSRVALGAKDHPTLSVATYWKVLAASAFAQNQSEVLLFSGDVTGLREFMRVKTSKQAAKNMRARSFYVQMLSQVLARAILRELELPLCNLLFEGASRFLLMLPVDRTTELEALLADLSRRLLLLHGPTPALQCAYRPVPLADLFDQTLDAEKRTAWQKHSEKLQGAASRAKNRLLKYLLATSANEATVASIIQQRFFQPHNGRHPAECNWCGVELSESDIRRNRVAEDEEDVPRCSQCRHLGWTDRGEPGLAQQIAEARFARLTSTLAPGASLMNFHPDPDEHFAESRWRAGSQTNAPTWRECLGYLGFDKGALRTAFMNGFIRNALKNENPADEMIRYRELVEPLFRNRRGAVIPERAAASMETRIFRNNNFDGVPGGRDIFRDLFRHLVVRDSSALPISGIKVELHTAKTGKLETLGGQLDLTYEALASKTVFETEMVWQQRQIDIPKFLSRDDEQRDLGDWLRRRAPELRFEQFLHHCRTGVAELLQRERDFYASFGLEVLRDFYDTLKAKADDLPGEQGLLLPLGWGTGWRAKTLAMLKLDENFETWLRAQDQLDLKPEEKVYPRGRHIFMKEGKPAQPLGWVKLIFKASRVIELAQKKVKVRKL